MAKDLIIVRAGKRSLHHTWLDTSTARDWDLLVSPYEDLPRQQSGIFLSDPIKASGKYLALAILMNEWQAWRNYRYVALIDDDIFASQQTWSRFFELCSQFGVKLAQPALSQDSFFSHTVTVRNTEFVARRVSFVEAMNPCFRVDVFSEFLNTFGLSESGAGWGLDFLWAKKLAYKDIFVMDETPVLHTRPLSSHADPDRHARLNNEMGRIMHDHQAPWFMKSFSGILSNGKEIHESDSQFLYLLLRGYQRVFDNAPDRLSEMIRLQFAGMPNG